MTWLPKGERPKDIGSFWIQYPGENDEWCDPTTCEIFGGSCDPIKNRVLYEAGEKGRSPSDPRYDSCRFAPAVPPPDWDLVEALESDPCEQASEVDPERPISQQWIGGYEAGNRAAVGIARAYLAGEPKP